MASFRILIAALPLGAGLALGLGAPAFACSCAAQTPAQHAEGADVVFAGTLTDVEEPPRLPVVSTGDESRYTFDVDAVYAGDPTPVTAVSSDWSGASCGLEGMQVGERYVVFAQLDGQGLAANLCGGTGPAAPRLEGQVSDALGPAEAPDPAGQHGGEAPAYPSPAAAWVWVGGLLAVVVPLWWLWSRRVAG